MAETATEASTNPSPARPWLDATLLAVLLLLAGGIHAWMVGHTLVPARDGIGYIRYALHLEALPWTEVLPKAEQHPLYPLTLLAMSYPVRHFLGGTSCDTMMWSAQWSSALAGILLVVPMFYLGRELFDRRVGFWAAVLFQVLPVGAQVTSDTLSDPVFFLLACTGILFGVQALRTQSPLRFVLCGLGTGLAYLTRPEGGLVAIATLLVLLGMQALPAFRWNWRKTTTCAAGLCLATLLVAGPYMAVIGGVTGKPTGKKILGVSHEEDTLPPPVGQQRPTCRQPLLASLVAVWWTDRQHDEHPPLRWAVWAVSREIVRSSQYMAWLPAFVGLWWFRARLRAVPGIWAVLVLWIMHVLLLVRLALKVGYVSERHTLFLVLLGSFWAVATLLAIGDRLPALYGWLRGRSLAEHWRPAVSATWLALLMAALLPWTLKPMHANRAGHRAAGLWLAEHANPNDIIVDPFCWAHYYAGAVFREGTEQPADYRPVHFVVIENSINQHTRLPALPDAKRQAEQGTLVYQWVPSARARKERAEEVVIYACAPAP